MIVKEGTNWVVKDHTGKNTLGTHPNEAQAKRQLAAIEASKHKTKYVSQVKIP